MGFNCVIVKDVLYQSLQKIVNIIPGRPRLPVLNYVLLEINGLYLYISSTDLEVEMVVKISLDIQYFNSSITAPGRKFFEICRSLPNNSIISMTSKKNTFIVRSGNSNFVLSSFEVSHFPKLEIWNTKTKLVLVRTVLKRMIELTQFSMGNQDARYYLNGMLFEVCEHTVRVVATDGCRLAMCETCVDVLLSPQSIIIPRKGVIEILRLLSMQEELVNIQINYNKICMSIGNYIFSSKLIDAIFPNYQDIFIKKSENVLEVSCDQLKGTIKRAVILSNEKTRVIQFHLTNSQLKITAHNFEHETVEETLNVFYSGKDIVISFNADYILDILNVVEARALRFFIMNEISSVQIEGVSKCYNETYIVMPIRI